MDLDLVNVDERYDVSQVFKLCKRGYLDAYSEILKYWLLGAVDSILRSFFASVVDGVSVSEEIKNSVDRTYQIMGWMAYLKN